MKDTIAGNMEIKEIQSALKVYLSKDIAIALDKIEGHLKYDSTILNDFIHQKGKFNSLGKLFHNNLISIEDYFLNLDKIRFALISLIDNLSEDDIKFIEPKNESSKLKLELTISGDYSSFTQEEQDNIISGIKELLNSNSDLKIIRKRKGSVILTIGIDRESAKELIEKFYSGELEHLRIFDINPPKKETHISEDLRQLFNERGEQLSPVLPDDKKNFLIDIGGSICDDVPNEEPERMSILPPYPDALKILNKWYDEGHIITFFTSRTSDLREVTENWLKKYGFKYHNIIFNKPRGGNYHWIDNHIVKATRFKGKFTDLIVRNKEIEVFQTNDDKKEK